MIVFSSAWNNARNLISATHTFCDHYKEHRVAVLSFDE